MRNLVMEMIGTMFLVLAIGLTGDPLAIGIMLMVMVYAGGHISGAHYNPAATLGIWMRGKMDTKDVAGYMIAQIIGAFIAAAIVYMLKGNTIQVAPGDGVPMWQSILVEALFTFALVTVILNTATAKKMEGNYIYGLAIGLTVTTSAYAGGAISGGAFNPAVGLGPIIMDTIMGGSTMSGVLIYLIGPFLGGALAAVVFKYLNAED